jgi:hypothetical protein
MRILVVGILILVFGSCDKNIVIVPEFQAVESERVVLLEEMTGVSCPNCPKGTAEVDAIKQLYGDQVIPVGIHGFFLSWPTKESEFDFRNDFAKQLEMTLAPGTSKPAALINRSIPSGETSKVFPSPDLWAGYVEEQLNEPPKLSIEVDVIYDPETRKLNVNAGVLAIENIASVLKISVMILENNIIDAQEDLNDIIEEFEHNHVLRTMLTPFDGEPLVSSLLKSDIVNKQFVFTVPEDPHLWKVENLEIVVFVHEAGGSEEVLQSALAVLPL